MLAAFVLLLAKADVLKDAADLLSLAGFPGNVTR
jgi:hypothetical protein